MDAVEPSEAEFFFRMATALGAGLLVGLERGWEARDEPEGSRVAGIRTFGLLGLGGALWWQLGAAVGGAFLGLTILGVTGFLTVFYYLHARRDPINLSVTSLTAAVLTFMIGGLCMKGDTALAVAAAVAATIILGVKDQLHGLLRRIDRPELMAVLKLLLMSCVLLPVLPNRGLGPYGALNPFVIWLIVISIASISFVGYAAVKLFGGRRGILIASLAGGLVSSTAVTLTWSKLMKQSPSHWRMFAGGIVVACAVMFARVAIISGLIAPDLFKLLAIPLVLSACIAFASGYFTIDRKIDISTADGLALDNPFELAMALKFGTLLAVVMLLIAAMREWMGDLGIYLLSFVTGLADVDAVAVSLARFSRDSLSTQTAAIGIAIAVASNSAFKVIAAFAISGRKIGLATALALTLALATGAAAFVAVGVFGTDYP